MADQKENKNGTVLGYNNNHHEQRHTCEPCKSFGQKCSHIVKKQRAKFYIVRRCIAMLVCWRDRGES